MWNDQQYYSRLRSHSFSGYDPAMLGYLRAPSPSIPTPQPNYDRFQQSTSRAPVSLGGFVIPRHGFEPALTPTEREMRERSREGGMFPSDGVHIQHRLRRHSQEPVYLQTQPKEHHHHRHKHRHGKRRRSSHSRPPRITVHANGQTYTFSSHPSAVHVYGAPEISSSRIRPSHSAQHLFHTNGAVARAYKHGSAYAESVLPILFMKLKLLMSPSSAHSNPAPQMQMPVPTLPPKDIIYYGPQIRNKRHYFQYSQCCRRKKALCIGVNYTGQANQLNGCINDAKKMRSFLIKYHGFKSGDIVLLTDEGRSRRERPTKRNMYDAMKWLVKDAQMNDSLVFHYSGHGGQTKDLDGDELDGYDEVIYPIDWKRAGHIVDDTMHDIMVKPLPAGCRLTAIFDCCHSGSALDLPYTYGRNGKLKREPNLIRAAGADTFGDRPFIERESIEDVTQGFGEMRGLGDARKRRKYALRIKTSPADVISWAGCKDSQTSADTYQNNVATGAMSYAFVSSLKAKPDQTYQELLINIRKILKNRFSQKPQLSSSHPIDTSLKFVI